MFQKFMNKKDFHPGSKWNIKRVWMAEQKKSAEEQRQSELSEQYKKEQEKFENRQLISKDEKIKLGLSFIYDAPPGFKDKNKDGDGAASKPKEEEMKFEWLKGAPRETYAKDLNLETHAQPFGIPVRNVRCIKCHKWGHVNTDRECPLHDKLISTEPSSLADTSIGDPVKLMQDMRNDGLTLKQNALGRVLDKDDPNQQYLASDDDDDPELAFLATLNEKQKRKLLRKLDKLENKERSKSKHKTRKRRSSSQSGDEMESKSKYEKRLKRKDQKSGSCGSDNDNKSSRENKTKEKKKRNKDSKHRVKRREGTSERSDYSSGNSDNERSSRKRKRVNDVKSPQKTRKRT